ncbi:MAG TPA: diheme cytochrome c [Dongiaceae bacterium]|nr:diheme cytochrome c [Dongiaceae bacterium]
MNLRRLTNSVVTTVVLLPMAAAFARGDSISPEDATIRECGACHMPYPPQVLPARSWQALIKGLAHHFNENASLDAATSEKILGYLVAHAADAPGENHMFMGGLPGDATPLRITDTPVWRRIHGAIPESVFANPKIMTKANCGACHEGADQSGAANN